MMQSRVGQLARNEADKNSVWTAALELFELGSKLAEKALARSQPTKDLIEEQIIAHSKGHGGGLGKVNRYARELGNGVLYTKGGSCARSEKAAQNKAEIRLCKR